MAYPIRNLEPNITHHIFSRCVETKMYLKKGKMKKMFCNIIKKAQKKYKFDLNGFMIMHNHFHFIITTVTDGATIDRIMQYIKSKFAKLYNKIHKRVGAFWSERYKNQILEYSKKTENYFNILITYLGYNPVKAGITKKPLLFKYSSFKNYLGLDNDLGIEIKIHPHFKNELFRELCDLRSAIYS